MSREARGRDMWTRKKKAATSRGANTQTGQKTEQQTDTQVHVN